MSLTIILATTNDSRLLAQLNRSLIEDEGSRNPMSMEELERRMRLWLENRYKAVLFQVEDNVVGYCLYEERRDEYFSDNVVIYIRQFFIDRDKRGQGLGRDAFEQLTNEIFPRGSQVELDVLASNQGGQGFWQRLGFKSYYINLRKDHHCLKGEANEKNMESQSKK